ncbi:hypothetical protein BT96DRAFT_1008231 [Gymnopus androsaceus JB14]|uniref:DUF6534 domain-containing protein n=1 Tax=Gymnopus androsaceus JB14 TaxID=1447944 RepID=A0A6A4GFD2_9AGAR|nr:hypothetical protein BT96DRAFT_1008231 [Gymnopus androsaceus JB14]
MSGLSAAEQAQINLSLGAVVVGNYLSELTMGIVLAVAWTYFSKFPTDLWWFKAIVILCVILCIADTVAHGIWNYDWAVANYGRSAALEYIHWAIPAGACFFSMCGLIVQIFYAWRLWVMSLKRNWILPTVVGCLSILGWSVIVWEVYVLTTHHLITDFSLVLPGTYIWLGGCVGADVLITGSMIYYLDVRFRIEHPNDYHAPQRFRRIIVRTVECNLLSLLAQAISVGMFTQRSVGFYYIITDMTFTKVYTFSLLVSLNSRPTENDREISRKSLSEYKGGDVDLNTLSDKPNV